MSFETARSARSLENPDPKASLPSLRIQSCDGRRAVSAGRSPAKAPLFTAAFFLFLATVPAFAAGAPTTYRIASCLLLLGLGGALLRWSWPKRTTVSFDFEARRVHTGSRAFSFDDIVEFSPTGDMVRYDDLIESRYQVDLRLVDGSRLAVLSHRDPSRVFADLARLAARVDKPVAIGWGLAPFPELSSLGSRSRSIAKPPKPMALRSSPLHHPRVIGKVVIAFGTVALFALSLLVGLEIELGFKSLPLSLFLPTCTAGFILLVGFAVLTRHDEILVDDNLRIVKRVVGLALRTRRVAFQQLEAVHLISPDAEESRHVLILTETGPLAFPYTGENMLPLIDALRDLAEPRLSEDHPARASGDE